MPTRMEQELLDAINKERVNTEKAGYIGFLLGALLTGILFAMYLIPYHVVPEIEAEYEQRQETENVCLCEPDQ